MAPSWRQLWKRIVTIWRLRRKTFLVCKECAMPLLPDEGAWHGRCESCHELLHVLPLRATAIKNFEEHRTGLNIYIGGQLAAQLGQAELSQEALRAQRQQQAMQNIASQYDAARNPLMQNQLGNQQQMNQQGLLGLLGAGLLQNKKPD